jgi:hypothetical protein
MNKADYLALAQQVFSKWKDDVERCALDKAVARQAAIKAAGGFESWMDQQQPGWRTDGNIYGPTGWPGPMGRSQYDIDKLAAQLEIADGLGLLKKAV